MPNGLYFILKTLIGLLSSALSPELFREWADKVIEAAKDAVAKSETQVDDELLMPLLELLDKAFGKE